MSQYRRYRRTDRKFKDKIILREKNRVWEAEWIQLYEFLKEAAISLFQIPESLLGFGGKTMPKETPTQDKNNSIHSSTAITTTSPSQGKEG